MQNYTGWTMGSKTVKLRGLNAKNRTGMQLLLNYSGPRVDTHKAQGHFSKNTRPNRYLRVWAVGSRSSGSDRMGTQSNLARLFLI